MSRRLLTAIARWSWALRERLSTPLADASIDYAQALADCEQALEIDPQEASAYGVRGLISYQQQEYKRALADFARARELGHHLFWIEEAYQDVCRRIQKDQTEET